MKHTALTAFVVWLEDRSEAVRTLETQANSALHEDGDQIRYKQLMQEKASLLARLADDAAPSVALLPEHLRGTVSETLGRFSRSAAVAKQIGSVFYMSALLYPEDHAPGGKNDLDAFVDALRSASEE